MTDDRRISIELVFLTIFLIFGPIYWLPGVPSAALLSLKAGAFGLFLILPYLSFRQEIYAVPKLMPLCLVMAVCLAVPSAVVHLNFDFLDYFLISFLVVLGYSLAARYGLNAVFFALFFVVAAFSILCAVVVLDFLLGGVFLNPIHESKLFLYQTGFHGGRTGWTGIVNVFLSLALIGLLLKPTAVRKTVLNFSVVVFLLNLFLVDSRGGLITGLLVLLVFLFRFAKESRAKTVLLLLLLFALVSVFFVQFADRLMMSRTYLSIFAPEELRSGITAGRTEGYLAALDLYLKAPALGVGQTDMREFGQEVERIHNVWLRVLVEQGLLGFLALLVFSVGVFISMLQGRVYPMAVYLMPIVAGLLPTLFEPTGVFGNFFATALFWVLIGLLMGANVFVAPQSEAKVG